VIVVLNPVIIGLIISFAIFLPFLSESAIQPMVFSAEETTGVGSDSATPVSDDFRVEDSTFTGRVRWVEIDLDEATEDLDRLITPEQRRHVARSGGSAAQSSNHHMQGDPHMTDVSDVDELGPVDYIVVEFPGSQFNGEIAPALGDLVDRRLVRLLDLLVLKKDADGSLEAFELSDLDDSETGELRALETGLAMLLSEDDVTAVAAAIEPGSSAAVLVWENSWAAPFATAVRKSGGQLVASGRIPIQALLATVEADDQEEEEKEGA
jgi:hypothetical protein